MPSKIAEDLGRLFEVGFNIGILACIQQYQIKNNFGDLYLQDLQELKLPKILRQISNKTTNTLQREIAEKWTLFFIQKGFLAGLNFFREYLKSLGCKESRHFRNLEICYYQCFFAGSNSIGTIDKNESVWFKQILSQFETLTDEQIQTASYKYLGISTKTKGEFFHADTLMLLKYRQQFKILVVDLSVFTIHSEDEDLEFVDILRKLLNRDISYLRAKSFFSQLRIDTQSLEMEFSENLKTYFKVFKVQDKETAKLIQAGSYAYSFLNFVQENGVFTNNISPTINIVGYSDRGMNTMSVGESNLEILRTCYEIYKHDSSATEIEDARRQVLSRIKRSAFRSFNDGRKFITSLLDIPADKTSTISHSETLETFFNSVEKVPENLIEKLGLSEAVNLRQAHAELITKALNSEITYLFLTGNPGIGKTTAIVNFLKDHLDEGCLFFYASPRKQVNLDIIEKLKQENSEKLCDDNLICLNSNANLIRENSNGFSYVVQYVSNHPIIGDYGVTFIPAKDEQQHTKSSNRLQQKGDDTIVDTGVKTRGVLNSICHGIYTVISQKISRNIVATVSIQSLKKTDTGDTLKHLTKIFQDAYNEKQGIVIAEKMKAISKEIKHLFIMIDEITGDDGGVEFLNGINEILIKYQLTNPEYGFNTKVIVADASIVDKNVILQHLENASPEPDKIYFRKALNAGLPLSQETFEFKKLKAEMINANSYPASRLHLTYNVVVESCRFSIEENFKEKSTITEHLQEQILQDLQKLLNQPNINQIIVYIQDKPRLAKLIEKITKIQKKFIKNTDFIEIHANLSETEKQEINQYKDTVKIIFMTASGSRGLSFPNTQHILVEIPRFDIEKNLMEVIQVIYRGRGNDIIDSQEKHLIFYLGDRAVYYVDNKEQIKQNIEKSVLSLLNILLILKASIMTRICGNGTIGDENFLMIPIGGKSISAAGESFSSQMATLIKELKREYNRNKQDQKLEKVYKSLENLLKDADFLIKSKAEKELKKVVHT